MTRRHALRDAHWERIKDPLPRRVGYRGGTAKDNRLFVDAVLYRWRAGIPGRDPPERFGDFRVAHTASAGGPRVAFGSGFSLALAGDADNEHAMIDSTVVRAHQHRAGVPKKTGTTKRW